MILFLSEAKSYITLPNKHYPLYNLAFLISISLCLIIRSSSEATLMLTLKASF